MLLIGQNFEACHSSSLTDSLSQRDHFASWLDPVGCPAANRLHAVYMYEIQYGIADASLRASHPINPEAEEEQAPDQGVAIYLRFGGKGA